MILKILERDKINYKLPTLTLDVNQIALKDPSNRPSEMKGLAQLEWNYFKLQRIELCVTPETSFEITQNIPLSNLGAVAYRRFQKSQLFKNRPPGTTLNPTDQESNTLWIGIRRILWPTVDDSHLTPRQFADVNQIFYHTIASGSLVNSAFITLDTDFHTHEKELSNKLGIRILTPSEAWEEFQPKYGLYKPYDKEIKELWGEQAVLFETLQKEASI